MEIVKREIRGESENVQPACKARENAQMASHVWLLVVLVIGWKNDTLVVIGLLKTHRTNFSTSYRAQQTHSYNMYFRKLIQKSFYFSLSVIIAFLRLLLHLSFADFCSQSLPRSHWTHEKEASQPETATSRWWRRQDSQGCSRKGEQTWGKFTQITVVFYHTRIFFFGTCSSTDRDF